MRTKQEIEMEPQPDWWFELVNPIRVKEETHNEVMVTLGKGLWVAKENIVLDEKHKNVLAVHVGHLIEFSLLKDELLATGNLTEEQTKTIITPKVKYITACENGYSEADAVKFANSNFTDFESFEKEQKTQEKNEGEAMAKEQTVEEKIANLEKNYSDFADESGRNAASDLSDEEFEFIKNHYTAGDMPDDVINKIVNEDNNYFKNKNIEAYKFTAYQTVLANLKEKEAMPEQAVVEEKKTQEKNEGEVMATEQTKSEVQYYKNTSYKDNEEIDWNTARQNEKINAAKAKNPKRHDKYGNELVSDEAFNVGLEAGKSYLNHMTQFDDLNQLKRSNVFLGSLKTIISNSIVNNGFNPNLDTTYQDLNEIAGNLFGEEIDFEEYELRQGSGFTGRKYMGYKPENTKKNEGETVMETEQEKKPDSAELTARLMLAQAAGKILKDEMNYFDAKYFDPVSDSNFEEKNKLKRELEGLEKPDIEQVKPHIENLLDEYTSKFGHLPLESYGWSLEDVRSKLVKFSNKALDVEKQIREVEKKAEGWNTSLNLKVYQNKEDAVLVKLGEPGHETLKDVWLPKEQVLISNKTGNIVGMNNDLYAKYRDYILPTQFSKNKIEPLEIHHATEKAVLVKLAIAGEEKLKDTWWPKYRVNLDKDEKNVVAIDNYLQKQYGNVLSQQNDIKAAMVGKSAWQQRQNEKAQRLADLEKNVPAEMKALPNWCVLKTWTDYKTGKVNKYVVNPNNPQGGWAKHNDPSNWTTFDKAMAYAKEHNGAGLSFAIKGSGFNAFDLDHCYDKETKTYNETAKKFLADLPNSYAERSVSGTGLHIFTKGSVCENGKYNEARGGAAVEVFETWGFVSMTGNVVDEQHKNLVDLPDAVKKSIQNEIGEKKVYQAPAQNRNQFRNYARSDSEVIDVIRKSKRANEFESLMNGADLCGDHSRSDLRLMGILAYFTNSNTNQMETIFKQSKLYRPDKGDSYVERTAKFAANNASQQAR